MKNNEFFFCLDSDAELNGKGAKQIELNSKHITVHQASEEDEERRTASLGDLSKLEFNACPSGNRSNNGTLERAQSLEITDPNNQLNAAGKVTPKKRKAQLTEQVEETDYKEPRLSEPILENLETLQAGRLKSAYEWGNLEDAIYDGKDKIRNTSDTESNEASSTPQKKLSASSMDMMSEVLAAADKFDREINDIKLTDVMSEVSKIDFDVVPKIEKTEMFTEIDMTTQLIDDTKRFIDAETKNGTFLEKPMNGMTHFHDDELDYENVPKNIKISPVTVHMNGADNHVNDAVESDQIKNIHFDANMPDDVKVSRYPLANIVDRPKSEVLKQLIAQQLPEEQIKVTNGITLNDEPLNIDTVITSSTTTMTTFNDGSPISLTLGNHHESDLTESSQISPVFSSDGQGVNSISISSNESPTPTSVPFLLKTNDNVVTITTEDSQPSSIIMIEDENINFTLRTLDDETPKMVTTTTTTVVQTTPPAPAARKSIAASKDEVFIIESLSSKKVHDSMLPISNGKDSNAVPANNGKPPTQTKNFVTEIRVANSKDKQMNAKNLSKSVEGTPKKHSPPMTPRKTAPATTHNNNNNNGEKPVIVEEEYIPRNSEIRFTTSTYQSPRPSINNDNKQSRHSHIDQIRSTFERSHTSEIPVPIRKISTPSTPPPQSHHNNNNQTTPTTVQRVSPPTPSKIPVFNSQKSSDNLLKNSSGGSQNANRVSVTSIKNSSRNPSGK